MARRKRRPMGGGGARNPNSLANLRRGGAPPAPPGGHPAVVKHGAFRTIPRDQLDAEIEAIYRALADSAPVRDSDGGLPKADEAAVEVAARALKRWRGVVAWCETFGRFEEHTGAMKPAAEYELQTERALKAALADLGLDPTARAKLGLDLIRGVDLATAMSHPDPEVRARLLSEAGLDEEGDQ